MSDAEALAWLRGHGRMEISVSDLARAWRWTRPSTYRRLDRWADEGRITKTGAAGGRWVVSAVVDKPDSKQSQEVVAALSADVRAPVRDVRMPVRTVPTHSDRAVVLPAILVATSMGLGVTGLVLNARFAASFGATRDAAVLLAAIGVALDVLAMVLPAAAAQLWTRGHRLFGLVAWMLWPAVLAMTLLAATGFAAGNLGDGIASRARTAETVGDLRKELERLRQERAGITEQRSTVEIVAAIARTRVAVWAWRDTRQCVSAVSGESRRACDGVLHLRQAEATAQRRDAIDAEAREMEARLAALPIVAAADPASFAGELVSWMTAGSVLLSPRDIYRLRVAGLVVAPSLAGLVLAFGLALGSRPR